VAGLRFYFDEDSLDHDVVDALRRAGIDVVTALDAGMIERPDEDHFAFAMSEGRILYTANVADFARLHARRASRRRDASRPRRADLAADAGWPSGQRVGGHGCPPLS